MRRIGYRVVITLAFLMGLLHCSLTFVDSRRLSANVLWFLGTGLALLFYSALNFIHAQHKDSHNTKYIVVVANLLMLLFAGLSVRVLGISGNPQVVALLIVSILMLLFSIFT